ncbi:MAG: tetratricopeptide repeat protein [Chloroflexota bacterium]|nr:tetratricopeptide repeat protein [Anaerolineales bacterium]MCB8967755.1 tetratricopeptide repeat protein [Ardenticatenaceae bacterium]
MEEWTLRDELRLTPVNVPRAALHYARAIAYPNLDIAYYMKRLDEIVAEVRKLVRPYAPVSVQAEAIATFLFQTYGLQGNNVDYFDPRNSYLNEVLQRRLGIPITLSVIFIHVARNLDLPAYGLSLPGHFIAGVHNNEGDLLFDPFHEGQRITHEDCLELVQHTSGYTGVLQKGWFMPVSATDTIVRMLNNLRMVYVQMEAWPQTLAVVKQLYLIQPDEPEHLRDLGLLYYQEGAMREAAFYLEKYLQRYPDAPEAKAIQQNVWRAFDTWVRGN